MHHRTLRKPAFWAVPMMIGALLWALALPAQASTLVMATTSLPQAQVGVAYSQTLVANGATGATAWALTAGVLPAGLSLAASTGVISGTPSTAGPSGFTVTVTDAASNTAAQSFTVVVAAAGTLAVTTASLPLGEIGVGYSASLLASGGTVPYAWSISAGTLPTGLSINTSTGVISGTPTAAGITSFTVQVADSASHSTSVSLSITVTAVGALAITTADLADGQVGMAYPAQTLQANGGVPPYTWMVAAGVLPAGLTLNSATGVISGTPTTVQVAGFTIRVTDAASTVANRVFDVSIAAASGSTGTLPEVLAACADGNGAHPQLRALCRIYTSGQLPPHAQAIVGQLILRLDDDTPDTDAFTERVSAACAAGASVHASLPSLCQLFDSGQLPPHARKALGKIILGVAGDARGGQKPEHEDRGRGNDDRDDRDDHEERGDRGDRGRHIGQIGDPSGHSRDRGDSGGPGNPGNSGGHGKGGGRER